MQDLNIIAVDDEQMNLTLIEELGKIMDIKFTLFPNPIDALEYIISNDVDILLTDYLMPHMSGIDLIERARIAKPKLLSLMITGTDDGESVKIQALKSGANDFLTKPLNNTEFELRVKNLISLKQSQKIQEEFNEKLKSEVQSATQTLIQREHEALEILSKTAEYKDPETASHVSRVAHYSKLLAKNYGLNDEEQEKIFYASPLHDIGKVGIRDDILLKPGKLDADEFEYMKTHALIGYNILKQSQNPFLQAGSVIALTHHEKYDGSGYPNALKADEIHIYGRITAIADVFDALTSQRPYKKAWSFEEASSFLQEQSAKHFDPDLVNIFLENIEEVYDIYQRFDEAQ